MALFVCDTQKIAKLWNDEVKNLIPGEEGAKIEEVKYISSEESKGFFNKLKSSRIDDNNRSALRLIKEELNKLEI